MEEDGNALATKLTQIPAIFQELLEKASDALQMKGWLSREMVKSVAGDTARRATARSGKMLRAVSHSRIKDLHDLSILTLNCTQPKPEATTRRLTARLFWDISITGR